MIFALAAVAPSNANLSTFTASAIIQVLFIGVLVAVLLIGGILVLNLGLMSKRREDRTGGRTPSDVGFLKDTNWPEAPDDRRVLPAEEDDEEVA